MNAKKCLWLMVFTLTLFSTSIALSVQVSQPPEKLYEKTPGNVLPDNSTGGKLLGAINADATPAKIETVSDVVVWIQRYLNDNFPKKYAVGWNSAFTLADNTNSPSARNLWNWVTSELSESELMFLVVWLPKKHAGPPVKAENVRATLLNSTDGRLVIMDGYNAGKYPGTVNVFDSAHKISKTADKPPVAARQTTWRLSLAGKSPQGTSLAINGGKLGWIVAGIMAQPLTDEEPAAVEEEGDEDTDGVELTHGDLAIAIIRALGLESEVPVVGSAVDYMRIARERGIQPLGGWDISKIATDDDIAVVYVQCMRMTDKVEKKEDPAHYVAVMEAMGIESADIRRVLHEIRVLPIITPLEGVYMRPLTPLRGR